MDPDISTSVFFLLSCAFKVREVSGSDEASPSESVVIASRETSGGTAREAGQTWSFMPS